MRYFLPKPYLLVTPLPEGKMDVSVVYLPDPDQEYAVDTHVYIASQDVHLEFADQDDAGKALLSKVTYEPKDPVVHREIVKGAGTMGKDIIDAKKAAKDAREEKRKAAETKLDELTSDEQAKQAVVDEKEYSLKGANAKLTRFTTRNPGNLTSEKQDEKDRLEDEVAKATHELEVAKADLTKSQKAVRDFKARNPSVSNSPADMSSSTQSVPSGVALLPGPALFEINESKESLSLELVKTEGTDRFDNDQMKLKTFMRASSIRQATESSDFAVSPPKESTAVDDVYRIPLEFHQLITGNVTIEVAMTRDGDELKKVGKEFLSRDGKTLTLNLPTEQFHPGKWKIEVIKGPDKYEGEIILK